MSAIESLVCKVRTTINRWRFVKEVRRILRTPVLAKGNDPFTVLSMVHHRDVNAYLLAIKSFCCFFQPRRIVMVADPSITDIDRSRIAAHIQGIEFFRAEDYREPGMPVGGTWERLIAISDLVQTDYVVQLDADTVTLAEMDEVRNAIRELASFVLGTEDGQGFSGCREAAEWARARAEPVPHIQVLSEANLDQLPEAQIRRYVRGCSGFSGFAPGSFNRERLRLVSQTMGALLGEKWSAWGTEQFSSNLMVSNSPRAVVLPHPKYCHAGCEAPGTVFLHFIGYVRFNTDRYSRAAIETCVALEARRRP